MSEFSRSELIQSEGSERTTSECEGRDGCTTLYEEFMPIKSDEHESCERIKDDEAENNNVDKKRSEWLQLWNQSPDPLPKEVTFIKTIFLFSQCHELFPRTLKSDCV